MAFQSFIDPQSMQNIMSEDVLANNRRMLAQQSVVGMGETTSNRLSYINQMYPFLDPDVQMALASGGATEESIYEVARMSAMNTADNPPDQQGFLNGVGRTIKSVIDAGGWALGKVGQGLSVIPGASELSSKIGNYATENLIDPGIKPVTRYGVAALDAIPESINNIAAMMFNTQDGSKMTAGKFWDSLTIATLFDNPELQGSGYLVNRAIIEEQARRARDFRGTIDGQGWTIGRGAANLVFTPGSSEYRYVSGFLDAMVQVMAPDPTKEIGTGLKILGKAGLETPLLTAMDASEIKNILKLEGGISSGLQGVSIDGRKWLDLMTKNNAARSLVRSLVKEKSATRIIDDIFKYKIDPAFADDLAKASTENEVLSVLTRGFTMGSESLIADPRIGRYARNAAVANIVERTPLKAMRGTRAFASMPSGSIIIAGDLRDRTNSIKNMLNSLRAAGGTKEEVAELGDRIIPLLRGGMSSDLEKNAVEAFKETVRTVMRKNRADETVINAVLNGGDARLAKMRSYIMGRNGVETDHGLISSLYERFKDDFPATHWADFHQQWSKMSGAIAVDRPLMLVELLNRVQVLPDARKLRRLTRSPMMRKLLADADGIVRREKGLFGKTLTSRTKKLDTMVVPRESRAAFNAMSEEIVKLKTNKVISLEDTRNLDDLITRRNALMVEGTKRVLTGEQRVALQVLEMAQNVIWKPLQLATGGYIVRNAIDAQIRMHFGAETGLFHPWQYITMLGNRAKRKAITGEDIAGWGEKGLASLRKEERELFIQDYSRRGLGMTDVLGHYRQTNNWAPVSRWQHGNQHTQGMVQNLGQISTDALQSIIARGRAVGKNDDEIFMMWSEYIKKNPDVMSEIRMQALQGIPFKATNGVSGRMLPIDFNTATKEQVDDFLGIYFDTFHRGNVDTITGGLEEMQYMAGFGRVPNLAGRADIDVARIPRNPGAELNVGDIVKMEDGSDAVISSMSGVRATKASASAPIEYEGSLTVVPLLEGNAFEGIFGSREATKLINKAPLYDEATKRGLPEYVKREIIDGDPQDKDLWNSIREAYDKSVSGFFTELVDKRWSRYTERSPVFRQFYWEAVDKHLSRMTSESADKLLGDLRQAAKREGLTVDAYLGTQRMRKGGGIEARLQSAAASGRKNGFSVEDIDDFARMNAVARTQSLLYDASERNNMVDMLRVIAPFANAWKEVLGTYLTQFATDSMRVYRSAQRVYTGLSESDPDGDGLGFFYDDPQTGALMFNFPFSHQVMNLAMRMAPGGGEPVNAFLNAPVKQLSQGLSVFPALGPMAQFAASEVLPRNDDWRAMRSVLLPYGDKGKEIFNPTPGWIQKFAQAWDGDINATSHTFAQTFVETLRAKSAMGKYDLSDNASFEQLVQDSRKDAQVITALRALSQFMGPTAGRGEFVVPTKQGDAVVGEVLSLFQTLQEQDYETAVQRFLSIMGDDMTLYVGSKTRALAGGLEGSEEFGRWQDTNEDLLTGRFKDVAGYFGPKGSELNFQVWSAQLQKGLREKLTYDELVESAQRRIGSALYADARRLYGPYRTEEQSKILREYRMYLHEQYPGFPQYVEFTTNALQNNIVQLQDLMDSGAVDGNPLVNPLRDYLNQRTQVMNELQTTTLSGKKKILSRQRLHEYGNFLASQSPEFDRIWNRLLVQEVDE